jgi:hypothetical protein
MPAPRGRSFFVQAARFPRRGSGQAGSTRHARGSDDPSRIRFKRRAMVCAPDAIDGPRAQRMARRYQAKVSGPTKR